MGVGMVGIDVGTGTCVGTCEEVFVGLDILDGLDDLDVLDVLDGRGWLM